MELPRFKPNDLVFGISDQLGWNGFHMIGYYRIAKVEIVPDHFKNDIPSEETRFVYYGVHFAAALELSHVFKDKDEFIEFIKSKQFENISGR